MIRFPRGLGKRSGPDETLIGEQVSSGWTEIPAAARSEFLTYIVSRYSSFFRRDLYSDVSCEIER